MRVKTIDNDTLAYQTNCLYQDHGQIVVCRRLGYAERGGFRVQCEDISRGIYFLIECVNFDASAIHHCYLNNQYSLEIDYQLSRELCDLGQTVINELRTTR